MKTGESERFRQDRTSGLRSPQPLCVFPEPFRASTGRGAGPRASPPKPAREHKIARKNNALYSRAVRLSGIFVYPIKACGGIALEHADVVERGLSCDRRYMLVDRTGTFITQREVPRLCLVSTALERDSIVVSTRGAMPLELPRELSSATGFERHVYQVWDSFGNALRHPEGSRWFSEFLNDEVSLVYMPDDERREVNPKRARPGDIVSFADGYPMLLISEASLADLNSRLEAPLEMRRFRPNLVLSECQPYAEDAFTALQIGALGFRAVKRCDRCVVTTINPDTGERGKEPLRTLSHYRLEDHKVWFGMNLIHDGSGTLHVGDSVRLV
jgi:uncharacterized protein YcbX